MGIWYYKNRNLDPELGRFLQTDPIGYAGGINLYAYVGNDPVNWVDPLGLAWPANPCYESNGEIVCQPAGDPPFFFGPFELPGAQDVDAGQDIVVVGSRPKPKPSPIPAASPPNQQCTVQQNNARHQRAVEEEIRKWESGGFHVTRNVSFRDPTAGNLRVVANFVVGLAGAADAPGLTPPPFLVVDVKTGGGGPTPNQRVVYPKFGGPHTLIPVGWRAFQAGLIPGLPISVRTLTLENY